METRLWPRDDTHMGVRTESRLRFGCPSQKGLSGIVGAAPPPSPQALGFSPRGLRVGSLQGKTCSALCHPLGSPAPPKGKIPWVLHTDCVRMRAPVAERLPCACSACPAPCAAHMHVLRVRCVCFQNVTLAALSPWAQPALLENAGPFLCAPALSPVAVMSQGGRVLWLGAALEAGTGVGGAGSSGLPLGPTSRRSVSH